jgi:3-oxoacyl-[acyl-carrier protein] reductase
MSEQSSQKVALVTGASRGIGAAVATRLVQDGFAVVINYSGDAAPAEALARELSQQTGQKVGRKAGQSGGRVITAKADVSNPAAVRAMFDNVESVLGGIDVLVNNAGIMTLANIGDMDDATFDKLIAVNLKGTFNTLREAAKRMRPGGRIINFSSSLVGMLLPTYAAYSATKAGVEAMTHTLAKELRGRNITVNAVAPGPTATDLFLNGKSPELVERMAKMAPLERLGQPQDIASVVAFLAGPDGAWVNGQVLRANGGLI